MINGSKEPKETSGKITGGNDTTVGGNDVWAQRKGEGGQSAGNLPLTPGFDYAHAMDRNCSKDLGRGGSIA